MADPLILHRRSRWYAGTEIMMVIAAIAFIAGLFLGLSATSVEKWWIS